jgi:hypothetical protein
MVKHKFSTYICKNCGQLTSRKTNNQEAYDSRLCGACDFHDFRHGKGRYKKL